MSPDRVATSQRLQATPSTAEKPPNFDSIARLYRWAEYLFLGPLLQRTREDLLPYVLGARRALVLGDGDGRFLAALLHRSPNLYALAVDTSRSMLDLLRRRCAFAAPRLATLHTSATALPPTLNLPQTDLIVSHFFLDCFTEPEVDALAKYLARHAASRALWLLSDFAVPPRQPWRLLGHAYIRLLYLAFRVLTGLRVRALPDIGRSLQSAGFHRLQRAERLNGLLYTELWQADQTPHLINSNRKPEQHLSGKSPVLAQLPTPPHHPHSCEYQRHHPARHARATQPYPQHNAAYCRLPPHRRGDGRHTRLQNVDLPRPP